MKIEALSDKDIKSLKILELIRKKGIISRTEISKTTGINIVSISNYMKHYIEKKLVTEKGFDVSTGGRKPELVELNKDENHVVGVDIGKDKIRVVLTNIGLDVLEKIDRDRKSKDIKDAVAEAAAVIDEIRKRPDSKIRAVGLGVRTGDCAAADKDAESKFSVETFAGDSALCAAFAERSLNKAVRPGNTLFIYSDIGCGVVVGEDGSSVSGEDSKYLRPWNESFGAVRLAKDDVARGVGTVIVELAGGRMENITEDTIIEAARRDDEVGLSIMRSVGMSLGLRIAYLVNLFGPSSVVIGGGIEKAGDMLLAPVKKTIKKLSLRDRADTVVVLPAVLGAEAVSMGAASLAAREVFLET